ncbi:MAG: hypothetical protein NC299_05210 [Lachnospiraceae bacterium]|nr:hypothetical protein [Ruminococcus sp.]MCM1274750.1 hypothetical protein [Lachnospiraceae bacterium]
MKAEQLFLLINEIDDNLVAEAEGSAEPPVEVVLEKRFPTGGIIAVASCAAALVICVLAVMKFGSFGVTPPPDSVINSSSVCSSDIAVSSVDSGSVTPVSDVTVNADVVWGIGKTFDEITERYGAVTSGNFNVYRFENGYGSYVFDYEHFADMGVDVAPVKTDSGCIMIDDISAADLLIGDISTLDLDNFVSRCGFETIPLNDADDPNTMYDGYRLAYYTHPSYENIIESIIFIMMYSEETRAIDETTRFTIRLGTVSETSSFPMVKDEDFPDIVQPKMEQNSFEDKLRHIILRAETVEDLEREIAEMDTENRVLEIKVTKKSEEYTKTGVPVTEGAIGEEMFVSVSYDNESTGLYCYTGHYIDRFYGQIVNMGEFQDGVMNAVDKAKTLEELNILLAELDTYERLSRVTVYTDSSMTEEVPEGVLSAGMYVYVEYDNFRAYMHCYKN